MKILNNIKNIPAGIITCLVISFLVSACGEGSGQGLDENGNLILPNTGTVGGAGGGGDTGGDTGGGDTGGGALSGNENATLAWVQTNVFGGVCSICHGGAAPQRDLNWSSETHTCSNVGKASTWEPTMNEIESGNPDASYLIWKLEGQGPAGEAIQGGQMPLNMTPLSQGEIDNIRDWISDGTPGCATSKPAAKNYASGTWKQVWGESLNTCASCHSIKPATPACSSDFECPPVGLVLAEDNYLGLIGSGAVLPFDLDGSSLWQSINSPNHLDLISNGYQVLNQTQIDTVRHWIENGAIFCPENQVCQ